MFDANQLRARRCLARISQMELAAFSGVSRYRISLIETGQAIMSEDEAGLLALALTDLERAKEVYELSKRNHGRQV